MLDLQILWGGQSHALHLADGEHTVGRSSDSAVKIPVSRVSKQHAVLRVDGDRLFVRDLESTNGTEVEGETVGTDEVEVPRSASVSFAGAVLRRGTSAPMTMTSLSAENQVSTVLRYNLSEGYSVEARDRIVGLSSGIFELLASGDDAAEVAKAACSFVAECVSADRVVLMENQSGPAGELEARARWTRAEDDGAPLQLSSTIVDEVLSQRDSVLVANPLEDPNYGEQKSIMFLRLRSAMAAPLFDNQRVRGILYVDTADQSVQYSHEDLEVLTATANAVAVKLRNLSFESEMRTAAEIQRAILPKHLDPPQGYELEAYQVMCQAVGGDLYHCLRRANGKVLFALGDVSGKGMPAAIAMSAAMVLIGLLAEIGGELIDLAKHLHKQLYRALVEERFITMFLGELDGETGTLRYVNAGQDPPFLLRKHGGLQALEPTGMALAMIEDPVLEEAEVTLEHGDLLAVFSDGIPEATTDGSHFLGADPVKKVLEAHSGEELPAIREAMVSTVEKHLAGHPPSDDVTLLLLRRSPA
jgi:serine phosphatase RsbU (regulator of sigma subunit)